MFLCTLHSRASPAPDDKCHRLHPLTSSESGIYKRDTTPANILRIPLKTFTYLISRTHRSPAALQPGLAVSSLRWSRKFRPSDVIKYNAGPIDFHCTWGHQGTTHKQQHQGEEECVSCWGSEVWGKIPYYWNPRHTWAFNSWNAGGALLQGRIFIFPGVEPEKKRELLKQCPLKEPLPGQNNQSSTYFYCLNFIWERLEHLPAVSCCRWLGSFPTTICLWYRFGVHNGVASLVSRAHGLSLLLSAPFLLCSNCYPLIPRMNTFFSFWSTLVVNLFLIPSTPIFTSPPVTACSLIVLMALTIQICAQHIHLNGCQPHKMEQQSDMQHLFWCSAPEHMFGTYHALQRKCLRGALLWCVRMPLSSIGTIMHSLTTAVKTQCTTMDRFEWGLQYLPVLLHIS